MEQYLHILKKSSLFDRIEDENLLRMLTCLGARVAVFDKKCTIFAEGTPAGYIGVVLSGTVQVEQIDYYGNRSILSVATASESFAEAFACAAVESLPVTVVATELSEVMLLDCGHILHTCSNSCAFHQQLIYNLMKDLASQTLLFHRKLEITSCRTTREKLLTYLALRAREVGSTRFEIPFDRQALADYLEVDRSGLSTEIGRLKREGVINNRKRMFELL